MAVLYRAHFHALELQLELVRRNIPFTITSGIRFFEQAHVKDVAAHLKFVANPRDEISFKRLVQLLPGIGGKGADKLWKLLSTRLPQPSQGESAEQAEKAPAARALQSCASTVPKKAATAWAQFVATIAQLEEPDVKGTAAKMIRLVLEAGYEDYIRSAYTNYRLRLEDLEQLAVFAQQFPALEEFLTQLALLTNVEAEADRSANRDDEQVRLSTVHQAKGLEFDVVFVIMLCDGLFPSARAAKTPEGEEEERRLMYVAITRARNELYLSYPLIRSNPGAADSIQSPSRFLSQIPELMIETWDLRPFA
jgi:DNA helicase-2/ATP-dependent DNA helicase PcrA